MESLMKLPEDMFKQELVSYLIVDDISKLDSAYMNHKCRPQLLEKISGVVLLGDKVKNDYVDQFRYTQHVKMRRAIRDNITMFIISHCSCLLSLDMSTISTHCTVLLSIKLEHCDQIISISSFCTGLQSLDLTDCSKIKDASIISISTHCTGLQSLNLGWCTQITDASIISISFH